MKKIGLNAEMWKYENVEMKTERLIFSIPADSTEY